MNIGSIARKLSFKELFQLGILLLRKPLLILPTFRATKKTVLICDQLYQRAHHAHGKENAFRHALWNILVAKYAYNLNNNLERSIDWAEKITDLHEQLSPNPPLEQAMDLHNNKIGRFYFRSINTFSEEEMVSFLKEQLEKAVNITKIDDIPNTNDILVYL